MIMRFSLEIGRNDVFSVCVGERKMVCGWRFRFQDITWEEQMERAKKLDNDICRLLNKK